ncbi:MAG: FeoA family protein [Candidatus Fermentibacteria bacterium]|nr:FeoA family protein [Candidatus Fermentibacteria bacterium]
MEETRTGTNAAGMPTSLSGLAAGNTASIVSLGGGRGFREKMNGMGLFPGTEITVVHTGGNGGMILISIGSSRLMVGHQMAEKILIQEAV